MTHLALELDLLLVAVRNIPLRQPGLTPEVRRVSSLVITLEGGKTVAERPG